MNEGVLLPYQARALELLEISSVLVWEKSRRIGATWGLGAFAALKAAVKRSEGGMDVFYIGFNLDMTREFVDTCAFWAKEFMGLAASVQEFIFKDSEQDIQAFRIKFASGFEIVALCSRPRSLRGRQGFVIIDEAAFHDELNELLKAALALLIWGGKVAIVSTHNGVDNPFNQLVEDCRNDRKKYALLRTTFDAAIEQGLYRRVCARKGEAWSHVAEHDWAQEIRDFYGDGADEELDVIPRKSGGRYLPRTLVEGRSVPVPVLRWSVPDEFVDYGEERRLDECQAWLDEHVAPILKTIPSGARSSIGEDFGRSGDLTVLWPLLTEQDLSRSTPFVIELRNVPFRQQEQIVFWLCDNLPRFSGGAFDARGNGQYLAEVARQRYGAECIAEVMLTESWYREHMPRLKAGLEDGTFNLPADEDLVADFRSLEIVRGVPRVPEKARKGSTGQRHGDGVIAAALALFASHELDAAPIEVTAAGSYVSLEAFGGEHRSSDLTGFM